MTNTPRIARTTSLPVDAPLLPAAGRCLSAAAALLLFGAGVVCWTHTDAPAAPSIAAVVPAVATLTAPALHA